MSFPAPLTDLVAGSIASELAAAAMGHCLRIDHLSSDVAVAMCAEVERRTEGAAEAFVLTRGS